MDVECDLMVLNTPRQYVIPFISNNLQSWCIGRKF
jgi:hypothetical protein